MAKLLSGKEVVQTMNESLTKRAADLREQGIVPCLAIVRVGERGDDIAYENGAEKRCEKVGVTVRKFMLAQDAAQEDLLRVIEAVNSDDRIHGCLLFRPLPKQFNDEAIRNALLPEKDVDGITDGSLAGVYAGTKQGFPPCTPAACMEILDYYGIETTGKRATIIGRSLVVGKPAAMMLIQRNATVTVCHSHSKNLKQECREADIIIAAIGHPDFVTADMVKEGAVVIDVGTTRVEDATRKRGWRLNGDVKFDEVAEKCSFITPVPGGVGPMTICSLMKNTLAAGKKEYYK